MGLVQVDLADTIDKTKSECLNEDDDHPFTQALHGGGGYLQSDCDEQVPHVCVRVYVCVCGSLFFAWSAC